MGRGTRRCPAALAAGLMVAALGAGSAQAALPDGRGYEQVSPVDKNGESVLTFAAKQAAASGNGVVFSSSNPFGASGSAPFAVPNLAVRSATGWQSRSLAVAHNPRGSSFFGGKFPAFADDLSAWALTADDPPLTPDAPMGFVSLYTHDGATGSNALVTRTGPATPNSLYTPDYADASDGFSHVLFQTNEALTPDAPTGVTSNLYETTAGQMRIVGVLPDGSVAPGGAMVGGSPLGVSAAAARNTISRDGSRIFFTSPGDPNDPTVQVYVRKNGTETVEASASQRTTPDPNGPRAAFYRWATPDGRYVYFTSAEELTDDADTGDTDQGIDLYEFNVETGALRDLSVGASAGDAFGAQVLGLVGASDDGGYVYFVAAGILAAGATSGPPNLYVWHDGAPRFIATLDPADSALWSPFGTDSHHDAPLATPPSRLVTPGGTRLAFPSVASLTGYDNAGHSELYLYDAQAATPLRCVSCRTDGVAATGDAGFGSANANFATQAPRRGISDDGGRVFFNSPEPLDPADVNHRGDVYEYAGGATHLISSGKGSSDSEFFDASASGDDVFFLTRDQLVSTDSDDLIDLYDARVGGGFTQVAAAQSTACSGDDCQGTLTPTGPTPPSPSSALVFEPVAVSGPSQANAIRTALKVAAVSATAKRGFARSGRLALKVTATAPAVIRATARSTLSGHAATVASSTAAKKSVGTVMLLLRLSQAARHQLSRKHRLAILLTVSAPGARSQQAQFTLITKAR